MSSFFTWNYWFSFTPPTLTPMAGRIWFGIAVLTLLAGILIRVLVVRRTPQSFVARAWSRVVRLLSVSGALLLVLHFFRYEGVPFFGARFWLLLLGIGDVVWMVAVVRHLLVQVPKEQATWVAQQQKQKYFTK